MLRALWEASESGDKEQAQVLIPKAAQSEVLNDIVRTSQLLESASHIMTAGTSVLTATKHSHTRHLNSLRMVITLLCMLLQAKVTWRLSSYCYQLALTLTLVLSMMYEVVCVLLP